MHDAALMGAPMVLLHFIKWIKQNTDCNITILLKQGGPLQTDFEKLGDVYLWRPGLRSSSVGLRIASAVKKLVNSPPSYIPYPKKLRSQKFDIIYINTADATHLAPMLKAMYKCPVIAHIHELSYSIKAYFPEAFEAKNIAAIDHYIAASQSVADNLLLAHHIPKQKVSVFNEFVPLSDMAKTTIELQQVKRELGITESFIVGASGQAGWRKGSDLFIQLAWLVNKKLPGNNMVFLWVGHQSKEMAAQAEYEIEKLNLKSKVIFTGSKRDPQNYFQTFDLFILTSREDPFPLVCIEAAALKKPIFCFKNSGGIPAIITPDTGATFDYGDIEAMAHGIIAAYAQPNQIKQMGENVAEMIKSYDVNVIAPQLYKFISTYDNNGN